MAYQDQIDTLRKQGKSLRKISESLGVSRNTVRKYLRAEDKADEETGLRGWAGALDWEQISKRHGSGIQINQLHEEHAPEGIALSTFYRRFQLMRAKTPKITIPLTHKPGEKAQIDYCDGIDIIDPVTCKITKTQLFVGVLPFSSHCFAEFSLDQKQASFLQSQENMWSCFGGVTPYLISDNLKSGVHKAHIYDPVTNPTYCDFANHHGFAVLPARPYRPKDKGCVEATVQALQQSFYQKYNRRTFTSLGELNLALHHFLEEFKHRQMKEHGASRWERFQQERDLLLPVAPAFDFREWTTAKVHPDCHIQVKHCFYSVPFQRVGQQVRVRISKGLVEIFDVECQPIAAHARLMGKGKRSMVDNHLPEERLQASRFEIKQAKTKAEVIGPKMSELMDTLFSGPRPLINLRRSLGILRAYGKDGIDQDAMEFAAGQCLTFRRFQLAYFRSCAKTYASQRHRSKQQAPHRDEHSLCLQYSHGKELK